MKPAHEYKTLFVSDDDAEKELNVLGCEGWHVIHTDGNHYIESVPERKAVYKWRFVLERQIGG